MNRREDVAPLHDLPLVVLAAGAGSRYGGPKQLAPIGPGGAALLEYSAFDAVRAGFSRVVLVVRPETEDAARARFAAMAARVPLAFARQAPDDGPAGRLQSVARRKPWGTGHAVLAARGEVAVPFGVVNADDFYGAGSFAALAGFLRRVGRPRDPGSGEPPLEVAMVGFPVADTLSLAGPVSRALCRLDEAGRLRRIVEAREVFERGGRLVRRGARGDEIALRGDELVSMNMWGFTPGLFLELRRRFEEFVEAGEENLAEAELLLPDVVQSLVRQDRARVEVFTGSGPWCGLTYPEDERRARSTIARLVAEGRYPRRLWE